MSLDNAAGGPGIHAALLHATRSLLDDIGDERYAIILSGGVDTAAALEAISVLNKEDKDRYSLPALAVTVFASDDATDRKYAGPVAAKFDIPHRVIDTTCEDLIENQDLLDCCVSTLETFDGMELRNTLVPVLAIKTVIKEEGIKVFVTGDAADELMGGYSFFWRYNDEEFELRRKAMVDVMSFSSPKVGKTLGAKVLSPYLQQSFIDHALSLGKGACVADRLIELYPGYPREVHTTGKVCLREAFPDSLSAWRRKDPIEVGSGSTQLSKPEFWENRTVEVEVDPAQVVIRDKEHATYYLSFLRVFPEGRVKHKQSGFDPCIGCKHDLHSPKTLFCRTCGAWPARKSLMSWSSGKDSCWTYHIMKGGVKALWTNTSGNHVKVHKSVPVNLLRQQAEALGCELLETAMDDTVSNVVYEEKTKATLTLAKEKFGVTSVCYGDLFLTDIVEWRKQSLKKMDIGLSAYFPLYNPDTSVTSKLAREMIGLGLKAVVVVLDTNQCERNLLGREFDLDFIEECEKMGIDPCGENGEFHTFAYMGPMFSKPIEVKRGDIVDEGRFLYQLLLC